MPKGPQASAADTDDGRVVAGGNRGALRSKTLLHTATERAQKERAPGYPDQSGREYYLPLDKVVALVKEHGAKRVGIQFPNGLRDRAWEVAEVVAAKTDAVPVVSGDLCFGACDLVDRELADLGVDLLLHFGHFEMPHLAHQYKIPVAFVPVHTATPLLPAVEAALPMLRGKRIAVTTVAQHADKLAAAIALMSENGVDCKTARGDARLYNPGQLIGCNYTAAVSLEDEIDAYLYLGTGDFHPLGLALSTDKPVICADPFTREVRELSGLREKFLKQRWAQIGKARDAATFGILVSTKTGQMRMAQALAIQERLQDAGRVAHIIALGDITPDTVLYFRHLDAFVVAACPRVGIDDQARYDRPMLTVQEVQLVLDPSRTEYVFDEINPKNYLHPIL